MTNNQPINDLEADFLEADLTTQPIADVQAQIARVDTKASILFGLALAALTGGTAVASKAHLPGIAVAGAVLTATLTAASLVLLGMALRPALGGYHGFVRWASMPSPDALRQDLFARDAAEDSVSQLWLLSHSAYRKYRRIRLAVDLLGVALACAAVTAALSGLS